MEQLGDTALFAARFREAAARALLLPRRRPDRRTPLWLQRRRAAELLRVAKQYGSFPIVLEAYREILQDDFDLPALLELLTDIRARRVRLVEVDTLTASPFATSLLFEFVAAYLYEGDTPLAERRAAALTLDRELLRELLGEGELRELLSPDVIASVELDLQSLAPERRPRGLDGVHDLLRRLGPLTTAEVAARTEEDDADSVLAELEAQRRAIRVRFAGRPTWAAAEDAARLRDALGIQPPPGLPQAFLEPVPDPLGDVLGRYARTHGPFTAIQAATDLAVPLAVANAALASLEAAGRVTRGAFRPGGEGREWVDAEVLRRLKRRSLARLREEIEPVEAPALGRFLSGWQGVTAPVARGGPSALLEVLRQLQGAALPASILERDVLASRLSYTPEMLDQLMVAGEVVWVGRGPIGPRDGRLALYFRDRLPTLYHSIAQEPPAGPAHDRLRAHLAARGASFFRDLYAAAGGGDPQDTLDALWDLVWSGEVTNDSLAPLRAFLLGRARRSGRRASLPSSLPPSSAGRWYLVGDLLAAPPQPTAIATAWAEQLLERHGVLTRAAVAAEGTPGAFASLYPVLSHLEETGRVRRGYFVEGLGGAQFALPGAVDRLREATTSPVVVLAAADPANPYGAALPWPDTAQGRASRAAGAYLVLTDGAPALYLERGGRRVLTFSSDADALQAAAAALVDIGHRRRRLIIEMADGAPVTQTPLGDVLVEAGFVTSLKGLAYRG